MLDKEFAERQLTAALASLEQIKAESLKKQLYLERIAQPSEPDKAQEPRRIQSIIAIFLLSLVIWGIISIIIGGVREHHDK